MSAAHLPTLPQATSRGRSAINTYVVTGAAGFIGSHLSEALLARGDAVIGIDAFTDYYARVHKQENLEYLLGRPNFTFLEADLVELALDGVFMGVDGIFHLAAQPGVRGSWGATFEHYVRDNVRVTQRIFEAAATAGIRVVYASSSSVYGDAEGYPTPEETIPQPRSPYGVTKLTCEHLANAFHFNKDLDAIGMRYFTVYGPRQRPDMATQRIAQALIYNKGFEVFGTGEQSRDVTYVEDAVRATISVMELSPGNTVYNVGGGSETTLNAIIAHCEEIVGEKLDLTHKAVAAGDVKRTAGDTSRIERDTGWTPIVSLEEGLTSQMAWAMSHRVWDAAAVLV